MGVHLILKHMKKKLLFIPLAALILLVGIRSAHAIDTLYDQSTNGGYEILSNTNTNGLTNTTVANSNVNCYNAGVIACDYQQTTSSVTQTGQAETMLINIEKVYDVSTTTFEIQLSGGGVSTSSCTFRSAEFTAFDSGYSTSTANGAGEVTLTHVGTSTCALVSGTSYATRIGVYYPIPWSDTMSIGRSHTIYIRTQSGTGTGSTALPRLRIQTGSGSTETVSISAPASSTSPIADFSFWTLNLANMKNGDTVSVLYFKQNLNSAVYEDAHTWVQGAEQTGYLLPKTRLLYQPPNELLTDWLVQAYVYAPNGTLLATSGYSFFTVNGTRPPTITGDNPINEFASSSIWNQVASSSLNCGQYAFTDNYIGGTLPFFASSTPNRIGCEMKVFAGNMATFFLVPSTTSTAALQNKLDSFKSVVPFSIFFNVYGGIISGVSTSTTGASSTLSINLPTLTRGTNITVPVLTSTTITAPLTGAHCNSDCATGIKTAWFTWISRGIWAGTGLLSIAILAG